MMMGGRVLYNLKDRLYHKTQEAKLKNCRKNELIEYQERL